MISHGAPAATQLSHGCASVTLHRTRRLLHTRHARLALFFLESDAAGDGVGGPITGEGRGTRGAEVNRDRYVNGRLNGRENRLQRVDASSRDSAVPKITDVHGSRCVPVSTWLDEWMLERSSIPSGAPALTSGFAWGYRASGHELRFFPTLPPCSGHSFTYDSARVGLLIPVVRCVSDLPRNDRTYYIGLVMDVRQIKGAAVIVKVWYLHGAYTLSKSVGQLFSCITSTANSIIHSTVTYILNAAYPLVISPPPANSYAAALGPAR
jgi:hypothetical protein